LARKTRIPSAVLEQATRSLAHRGPDDSGTLLLKVTEPEPLEIGLGHRRLARDPMGIKPLYYHQSEQIFVFASEVRTLLRTGLVPRKADPTGVLSYLM